MALSDLNGVECGAGHSMLMRKSFSIDSSLSMVSHHAAPRTHEDRPPQHRGHGMGLSGLKTLHEDRQGGRSPPGGSPRGTSPPPLASCRAESFSVPPFDRSPRRSRSGSPKSGRGRRSPLLLPWGAAAAVILAIAVAAVLLPASEFMESVPGLSNWQQRQQAGSTRPGSGNGTLPACACSNVDVLSHFELNRFMGDWHHMAWLHATAEASAWEHKVGSQCATAAFQPLRREQQTAGGTVGAATTETNGGGTFDVTFTYRPMGSQGPAGSTQQTHPSPPNVVLGSGTTPQGSHPAKLQVQLDSGHVLPYWVIATDYESWALMCTTSASLGDGHPAQVLTLLTRSWGADRLDIGDRLNDLAARDLPWKEVVFAPSASCAAAAAAAAAT